MPWALVTSACRAPAPRGSGRLSRGWAAAAGIGLCVSTLSLLGAQGAGAATGAAYWPTALHDPSHSATAPVVGPQTGHILWSRQLEGNVTPGPVVGAGGTIYLATNAGVLHALDPTTGQDLWTVDGGGAATGETDLSTSPLVLPDGSLLWPGPGQTLFEISAVDRSSGCTDSPAPCCRPSCRERPPTW